MCVLLVIVTHRLLKSDWNLVRVSVERIVELPFEVFLELLGFVEIWLGRIQFLIRLVKLHALELVVVKSYI